MVRDSITRLDGMATMQHNLGVSWVMAERRFVRLKVEVC